MNLTTPQTGEYAELQMKLVEMATVALTASQQARRARAAVNGMDACIFLESACINMQKAANLGAETAKLVGKLGDAARELARREAQEAQANLQAAADARREAMEDR